MPATANDKSLSIVEAARILFRTRSPSEVQVYRVMDAMKSGELRACDQSRPLEKWTISERALAEFMAANRVRHATQWGGDHRSADVNYEAAALSADQAEVSQRLRDIYQGILRDYFLAVLLRRRMGHRSKAFAHAVLIGQAAICVLMLAAFLGSLRQFSGWHTVAERQAIERWIEQETDNFSVTRWHPSAPHADGALLVRVEYRYQKESPRWIHTDRTFRVSGDEVAELEP